MSERALKRRRQTNNEKDVSAPQSNSKQQQRLKKKSEKEDNNTSSSSVTMKKKEKQQSKNNGVGQKKKKMIMDSPQMVRKRTSTIHDLPMAVLGYMLSYLEIRIVDGNWLSEVFPNKMWGREWMLRAVSLQIEIHTLSILDINFRSFQNLSNIRITVNDIDTNYNLRIVRQLLKEVATQQLPLDRFKLLLRGETRKFEFEAYCSLLLTIVPDVTHFVITRRITGNQDEFMSKCLRCKLLKQFTPCKVPGFDGDCRDEEDEEEEEFKCRVDEHLCDECVLLEKDYMIECTWCDVKLHKQCMKKRTKEEHDDNNHDDDGDDDKVYYVCGRTTGIDVENGVRFICGRCTQCENHIDPADDKSGICQSCETFACGDCMFHLTASLRGYDDVVELKCVTCHERHEP